MGKLDNKRALITGGGTGIGREIAARFLAEGARVIICGRRPGPLKTTADEFKQHEGKLHFIECDISDPDDVRTMADKVEQLFAGLDILVNNAGIDERGNLAETDLRTFDRVMNVNLRGTFIVTREFIPMLQTSGAGACVLNISSNLGQLAEHSSLAYCISKAGLDMLTRCCAMDYAGAGIRFNAIAPGIIDTPMQNRAKGELGYQEWRSQMEHLHPLRSVGMPKDIASAAIYLCSADADWITGVIMPVDGGMLAR
jgi:NAD(P)-dependent dehydrogenase (short-subunit alcohol dehydrogenase family)